jgi:hypothetical protein
MEHVRIAIRINEGFIVDPRNGIGVISIRIGGMLDPR